MSKNWRATCRIVSIFLLHRKAHTDRHTVTINQLTAKVIDHSQRWAALYFYCNWKSNVNIWVDMLQLEGLNIQTEAEVG